MESKVLINGLQFAVKNELTPKEMQVLLLFLDKPLTTSEAAKVLGDKAKTLHRIIQMLKLKRMIVLKDRDSLGNNLYEFNKSSLE